MTWQSDWKRWTHATYGLVQAVRLCEKLDGGNVAKIEDAVVAAASWSPSSIGFSSAARRQAAPRGTISVRNEDAETVLIAVRASIAPMLIMSTASITEVLLADLLVSRGIVPNPPANFSASLRTLAKRLSQQGSIGKHQWALNAAHELRIIRNVVVHASSRWSAAACDEFAKLFPGQPLPSVGASLSVNVDDVFAYRRAARTILNAAARA